MVVEFLRKGGKLVVVHHHGKAFLAVLTDERLDDGEGLTRAWRAHNPRPSERGTGVIPNVLKISSDKNQKMADVPNSFPRF